MDNSVRSDGAQQLPVTVTSPVKANLNRFISAESCYVLPMSWENGWLRFGVCVHGSHNTGEG